MSRKTKNLLGFFVVLLIVGFLCGIGVYLFRTYQIDPAKIYVEGNTHYTNAQISEMVMNGLLGDNSLYLSLKYKNRKITDVPFVDSITVTVPTKDSIKITVYEKALAGYVKYLDRFVYFDKDGYVVESSQVMTQGVPQVSGLSFYSMEVGKQLCSDQQELFTRTLDLTKLMEKYEMSVDRIFFHEDGSITLFFDQVRVDLGNEPVRLEDKMMDLAPILEHLKGQKGVLNMKIYDEDSGMYIFKVDQSTQE